MTMLSQTLTSQSSNFTPSLLLPNDLSPSDNLDDLSSVNIPEYPRKSGKWTAEEDDLLRKYVDTYGEKQWRRISHHIPGRTSIQCLHRWSKILRPGLVKGPWTPEEDQKLIAWIKAEGPNKWANAANIIPGRSGKQCRERWFNNLNPDVKKTEWTKEEDELIFSLYQKYSSSWSKIAKFVEGRTENSIKNRFYSTLRKIGADRKKNKTKSTPSEHSDQGEGNVEEDKASGDDSQHPHTLYKLLQESMPIEEEKEEEETKFEQNDSQKRILESDSPVLKTPKREQPSSTFKFNGEKLLIGRDGSVLKRTIEEVRTEREVIRQEGFQKFLLNTMSQQQTKENLIARSMEPIPQSPNSLMMLNLIQQRVNAGLPNLKTLNNSFRPLFQSPLNQKELMSPLDYQVPTLSGLSPNKPRPIPSRQDSSDLSNLIEIKIAEEQERYLPDAYNHLNTFKTAPLRSMPPTISTFKNPKPLNFNVGSRISPISPHASPLMPYAKLNLSDSSSMGLPLSLQERSDSQPGSALLKGLKSTKEMSQSSQSTQASLHDYNEGLAELHRGAKVNDLLLGMSRTINKASNMQQNCYSNLSKVYQGGPNFAQVEQNEARMQFLVGQLHSLDSLFSNVKGQLVQLETSLTDRTMMKRPVMLNNVRAEAEMADRQGKRMVMEMLRQNPLGQRALFEMDPIAKKVKFDQFN